MCVRGWVSRLDNWARRICVGQFRGLPVQIDYGNGQALPNPITTLIASIPTLLPQAYITHKTLTSPAKHSHTCKFFFTSQTAPKMSDAPPPIPPSPKKDAPKKAAKDKKPKAAPTHAPYFTLIKEVGIAAWFSPSKQHSASVLLLSQAHISHHLLHHSPHHLQALALLHEKGGSSLVALRKALRECSATDLPIQTPTVKHRCLVQFSKLLPTCTASCTTPLLGQTLLPTACTLRGSRCSPHSWPAHTHATQSTFDPPATSIFSYFLKSSPHSCKAREISWPRLQDTPLRPAEEARQGWQARPVQGLLQGVYQLDSLLVLGLTSQAHASWETVDYT